MFFGLDSATPFHQYQFLPLHCDLKRSSLKTEPCLCQPVIAASVISIDNNYKLGSWCCCYLNVYNSACYSQTFNQPRQSNFQRTLPSLDYLFHEVFQQESALRHVDKFLLPDEKVLIADISVQCGTDEGYLHKSCFRREGEFKQCNYYRSQRCDKNTKNIASCFWFGPQNFGLMGWLLMTATKKKSSTN